MLNSVAYGYLIVSGYGKDSRVGNTILCNKQMESFYVKSN
jgi:hypothetical protein